MGRISSPWSMINGPTCSPWSLPNMPKGSPLRLLSSEGLCRDRGERSVRSGGTPWRRSRYLAKACRWTSPECLRTSCTTSCPRWRQLPLPVDGSDYYYFHSSSMSLSHYCSSDVLFCRLQTLIEQNEQQAREILIQNPVLTKALFQVPISCLRLVDFLVKILDQLLLLMVVVEAYFSLSCIASSATKFTICSTLSYS